MAAPLISKLNVQQHGRFGILFNASSIAIPQLLIPRPTRLCRHRMTQPSHVWLSFGRSRIFISESVPKVFFKGFDHPLSPVLKN
ncbi:hypothetical protein [Picosynechococcus sp. PCC 7002]|uniref:hypothetical protein n=1 Tax=Picosynechococcus sp. (strain ATCC 27264 / PCC 7002 / PR-6) TaxID=32049 RepID=UPI0012EA7F34|nr:hypothetical protein [Picosynechococcus sp. PCC 7002]